MFSRREFLSKIGAAALVGPLGLEAAQHVHEAAAETAKATGGVYKPKALTQHEFDTLKALCELIVPGASQGGAADFIDLLSSQNPEMMAIYTGGLAGLDTEMKNSHDTRFLPSKPDPQTPLPDNLT